MRSIRPRRRSSDEHHQVHLRWAGPAGCSRLCGGDAVSGETHPRLAAAEATGDVAAVVAIAMQCRFDMEEHGTYCECADPNLDGGLMCRRCLHRSKERELRELDRRLGPHDFVESLKEALRRVGWCGVCTHPADDQRHHGIATEGMTSWGERYTPAPQDQDGDR